MAIELRVKEFSALPVADDGKTLLYADGSVKQSSKNLSEMLTDEVNNKLDTTAFSTVSGSFLTAHQVIPSGKWENASNVVIANSAIWESETDWTEDINAASAYAYEQAIEQIPDPFDPTFLSGEIDKKLDKTFSSNFYPMTSNPSGFLTEHQDLSNYYTKLETSSKLELTEEFNTKQNNLLFSGENNTITAINNSAIGGAIGEYVPLSSLRCTIGSGNVVNTSTSYFALAQGSANSAKEDAFAQGNSNYANDKSIAQGKNNSALYTSFAQGNSNYANNYCFTQGNKNSAYNYGLAQGSANSAEQESFANGIGNTAQSFSIAVGHNNSANQKSLAVGMNNTASYMGITIGTANSANMAFACGEQSRGNLKSVAIGYKTSADNMGVAFGDEVSAYRDALAQGGKVIAKNNSLAQGYSVTANEQAFAQGSTVSAYSNAFAQGQQVTATDISFAQGIRTKADNHSFVQGENVWAIDGGYSFGQGYIINASYTAMAQGYNVNASSGSLAQGTNCSAKDQSIAQGENCIAEKHSQAFGRGTVITNSGMAIGTYNKTSANVAFVIGNGTGDAVANRKDLFTIDKSGVTSGGDFVTSGGDKLSELNELITLLRNKPSTGTYTLKCVAGVLSWVEDSNIPANAVGVNNEPATVNNEFIGIGD